MNKTRRVCINEEDYDILICRPSIWGNQYTHIKNRKTRATYVVNTIEEAIDKYEKDLLKNEILIAKLPELIGKRLGCTCKKDKPCHGDVLVKLAEELRHKSLF
jgi:hypothetical protein